MNHHQRHLPPGVNRALRSLSLLLLALAFQHEALAMPRFYKRKTSVVATSPRGYLSTVGAPALRFEEPAPLPAAPPSSEPSSGTPSPVALAPAHSTEPASAPAVPAGNENLTASETKPERNAGPKTKTSPLIIPDDTRPAVHPEDFLPFFQFPSAGKEAGTLNVIVPVPHEPSAGAPLPPSSATYTQTPK